MLKGILVSKGIFQGIIKIIEKKSDIDAIKENNIIVVSNNNPFFSTAYIKAGGIISEVGGQLFHLAIIARELNKPAIFSVKDATKILKNNMIVKIGKEDGTIKIIK